MAGELFESPAQVYQRLEKEKEAGRIAETAATAGVDPIRLGFQRQRAGREDITEGIQRLFGHVPPEVQAAEQQQKITEAIKHIPFGTEEYYQAAADEAYRMNNLQVAQKFIALRDQAATARLSKTQAEKDIEKTGLESKELEAKTAWTWSRQAETNADTMGKVIDNITRGAANEADIEKVYSDMKTQEGNLKAREEELAEKKRNNNLTDADRDELRAIEQEKVNMEKNKMYMDSQLDQAKHKFEREKFGFDKKAHGQDLATKILINNADNQTKKEIAEGKFKAPSDITQGDIKAVSAVVDMMDNSGLWDDALNLEGFTILGMDSPDIKEAKNYMKVLIAFQAEKYKVSQEPGERQMSQNERIMKAIEFYKDPNNMQPLVDAGLVSQEEFNRWKALPKNKKPEPPIQR